MKPAGCRDAIPLLSGTRLGLLAGVERLLASALVLKAIGLRDLDQRELALETIDRLLHRFSGREDLALREQAAAGLSNKAVMLEELDRLDDARASYDNLLKTFTEDESPTITSLVAWASTSVERLA